MKGDHQCDYACTLLADVLYQTMFFVCIQVYLKHLRIVCHWIMTLDSSLFVLR